MSLTADDAYKATEEARAKGKDVRLDKHIEFIERDIQRMIVLGRFQFLVDWMDKPVPDDFILKVQDHFIANGFTIKTDDDPARFRYFVISWNKDSN
jgi:hypothetical protein